MCIIVWMLSASLLYVTDGDRIMFKYEFLSTTISISLAASHRSYHMPYSRYRTVPDALYTVFQLLQGTFPWGDDSEVGVLSTILICILCATGYALWAVPMGVIASGFVLNMTERRKIDDEEKTKADREYQRQLARVKLIDDTTIPLLSNSTSQATINSITLGALSDNNSINTNPETDSETDNDNDDFDDEDGAAVPHCISCCCDAHDNASLSSPTISSPPSSSSTSTSSNTTVAAAAAIITMNDTRLHELRHRVAIAQAELAAYEQQSQSFMFESKRL
jgi:hypothetical protein